MRYVYILMALAFSFAASAQTKQVTNQDTAGSGKPVIFLRCQRSIAKDQPPLIVVDGVPVALAELSTMDVNDIESIIILKGVQAAVLYGSEGASGVIVITTKKMLRLFVKDMLDKAPVERATISFVSKDRKDTLMGIADSSGCFSTAQVKTGIQYDLNISAVGYDGITLPYISKGGKQELQVPLTRKCVEIGEVVLLSMTDVIRCGRRYCCCGQRVTQLKTIVEYAPKKVQAANCYPNPLPRGGTLHVELRSQQAGTSTLRMLSAGGALVKSQQVSFMEGTNRVDIPTDGRLVPGTYFVILFDEKQQPVSKQKVVIQ